jgi:tetratricopeptide (TPR) repeat protein
MKARFPLIVAVVLVLAGGVSAQKLGSGVTPSSPGNLASVVSTVNPATSSVGDAMGPGRPSVFVTGRVVMQDGGDVPVNVVIEKECNNRVVALGYTDRKGAFSVNLDGQSSDSANLSDASYEKTSTNSRLENAAAVAREAHESCEIRASYAGYHSETVNIGYQHSLDNPDVGTLVLHRNAESVGTTISATLLNAPKPAVKAYQDGMMALRKGNVDAAEKHFIKATELHPTFASAWYELGRLEITNNTSAAKSDLEKAVQADPKYVLPYIDLANLAAHSHNWTETVEITDRALHLDPTNFPELFYFNAAAHFNLKQFDDAEKRAREAIRLDSARRVPKALQLLAYVLAAKGDLRGSSEQMRAYLATGPNQRDAEIAKADLAKVESHIR